MAVHSRVRSSLRLALLNLRPLADASLMKSSDQRWLGASAQSGTKPPQCPRVGSSCAWCGAATAVLRGKSARRTLRSPLSPCGRAWHAASDINTAITQQILRNLSRKCICLSRLFHGKRFLRALVVLAVDPVISSCPNSAQICRPAFVLNCSNRRQRFDQRANTNWSPADLSATDLEDPLNRVLLQPRSQTTVLYPKDGSASIISLIGSPNRASTFSAALVEF